MERNRALEIVRRMEILPIPENADLIIALHTLIPELRESEDERIRKEMIKYFTEIKSTVPIGSPNHFDSYLVYLEKQKEQKSSINIDQLKSLMLKYLQEAANEKDDSDIEADTDKWAKKILGYDFEQKPVEFGLWKDTKKELPRPDSLILVQDFDVIRSFYYEGDGYLDKDEDIKLSRYQKWCYQSDVKEIKSVDWSEGDEREDTLKAPEHKRKKDNFFSRIRRHISYSIWKTGDF